MSESIKGIVKIVGTGIFALSVLLALGGIILLTSGNLTNGITGAFVGAESTAGDTLRADGWGLIGCSFLAFIISLIFLFISNA